MDTDFLCTQAIPDDLDETEESDEERVECGMLKVLPNRKLSIPSIEFQIYNGENTVGRHTECAISIPWSLALSKKHAVIEAEHRSCFLCDYGSSNKTRLNNVKLKPNTRYGLRDGDEIVFADVKCIFKDVNQSSNAATALSDAPSSSFATPKPSARNVLVDDTPTENRMQRALNESTSTIPDSQPAVLETPVSKSKDHIMRERPNESPPLFNLDETVFDPEPANVPGPSSRKNHPDTSRDETASATDTDYHMDSDTDVEDECDAPLQNGVSHVGNVATGSYEADTIEMQSEPNSEPATIPVGCVQAQQEDDTTDDETDEEEMSLLRNVDSEQTQRYTPEAFSNTENIAPKNGTSLKSSETDDEAILSVDLTSISVEEVHDATQSDTNSTIVKNVTKTPEQTSAPPAPIPDTFDDFCTQAFPSALDDDSDTAEDSDVKSATPISKCVTSKDIPGCSKFPDAFDDMCTQAFPLATTDPPINDTLDMLATQAFDMAPHTSAQGGNSQTLIVDSTEDDDDTDTEDSMLFNAATQAFVAPQKISLGPNVQGQNNLLGLGDDSKPGGGSAEKKAHGDEKFSKNQISRMKLAQESSQDSASDTQPFDAEPCACKDTAQSKIDGAPSLLRTNDMTVPLSVYSTQKGISMGGGQSLSDANEESCQCEEPCLTGPAGMSATENEDVNHEEMMLDDDEATQNYDIDNMEIMNKSGSDNEIAAENNSGDDDVTDEELGTNQDVPAATSEDQSGSRDNVATECDNAMDDVDTQTYVMDAAETYLMDEEPSTNQCEDVPADISATHEHSTEGNDAMNDVDTQTYVVDTETSTNQATNVLTEATTTSEPSTTDTGEKTPENTTASAVPENGLPNDKGVCNVVVCDIGTVSNQQLSLTQPLDSPTVDLVERANESVDKSNIFSHAVVEPHTVKDEIQSYVNKSHIEHDENCHKGKTRNGPGEIDDDATVPLIQDSIDRIRTDNQTADATCMYSESTRPLVISETSITIGCTQAESETVQVDAAEVQDSIQQIHTDHPPTNTTHVYSESTRPLVISETSRTFDLTLGAGSETVPVDSGNDDEKIIDTEKNSSLPESESMPVRIPDSEPEMSGQKIGIHNGTDLPGAIGDTDVTQSYVSVASKVQGRPARSKTENIQENLRTVSDELQATQAYVGVTDSAPNRQLQKIYTECSDLPETQAYTSNEALSGEGCTSTVDVQATQCYVNVHPEPSSTSEEPPIPNEVVQHPAEAETASSSTTKRAAASRPEAGQSTTRRKRNTRQNGSSEPAAVSRKSRRAGKKVDYAAVARGSTNTEEVQDEPGTSRKTQSRRTRQRLTKQKQDAETDQSSETGVEVRTDAPEDNEETNLPPVTRKNTRSKGRQKLVKVEPAHRLQVKVEPLSSSAGVIEKTLGDDKVPGEPGTSMSAPNKTTIQEVQMGATGHSSDTPTAGEVPSSSDPRRGTRSVAANSNKGQQKPVKLVKQEDVTCRPQGKVEHCSLDENTPTSSSARNRTRGTKRKNSAASSNIEKKGSAKKVKSEEETDDDSQNISRSLRQRKEKPKVMFTGVLDSTAENVVHLLGGEMASDVNECTHLVTDKMRRTIKFLCAVVRGIHILTLDWLHRSGQIGRFLPEEDYLLTDDSCSPGMENLQVKYSFSLPATIQAARSSIRPLFEGLRVFVTSSVVPAAEQMNQILKSGGAEILSKMPTDPGDTAVTGCIVVATAKDKRTCALAIQAGCRVVSNEFVLTGVLRHVVDFESHALFGSGVGAPESAGMLQVPAEPALTKLQRRDSGVGVSSQEGGSSSSVVQSTSTRRPRKKPIAGRSVGESGAGVQSAQSRPTRSSSRRGRKKK